MSSPAFLRDLLAPAKLNLFLHITGRRTDGYHLLESVFMRIDWCDTLHLSLRSDGVISREDLCNQSGTVLGEADLCVRAARALQQALGTPLGAHIQLEKRIPAEAGMGGGSSDAATVFMGLARLWLADDPTRLAQVNAELLPRLAVGLGADVPFFLLQQHALVAGIGERLWPLDLPEARFVVVKPVAGVSTPAIFRHPALERNVPSVLHWPASELGRGIQADDAVLAPPSQPNTQYSEENLGNLGKGFAEAEKMPIIRGFAAHEFGFGRNSLQPVAETLCPAISQALAWLKSKGLRPRMTGSGSAVFAHLGRKAAVPDLSDAPDGCQVRVCSNRVQGF